MLLKTEIQQRKSAVFVENQRRGVLVLGDRYNKVRKLGHKDEQLRGDLPATKDDVLHMSKLLHDYEFSIDPDEIERI